MDTYQNLIHTLLDGLNATCQPTIDLKMDTCHKTCHHLIAHN